MHTSLNLWRKKRAWMYATVSVWCQCDSAVGRWKMGIVSVTERVKLLIGISLAWYTVYAWQWCIAVSVVLTNIHSFSCTGLLLTLSVPSLCASVLLIPISLFALALCFGSALKLVHRLKDREIYNDHMGGECANVPVTEFTLDMKCKWPSIQSTLLATHFCYVSTTDGKQKSY